MPPRDACDGVGGPAARLAARLDAGVRRAWIERAVVVLALGIALASAAAAADRVMAAVFARGFSGPAADPGFTRWIGGLVVIAAATFGAVWWLRRTAGGRRQPLDRLAVALATEAEHPGLGERVSSAVGFLETPGGSWAGTPAGAGKTACGTSWMTCRVRSTRENRRFSCREKVVEDFFHGQPGEDPLTAGLRRLAVVAGSRALDDVATVSIPGAADRRRLIAGGVAATVAAVAVHAGAVLWARVPQRIPAESGRQASRESAAPGSGAADGGAGQGTARAESPAAALEAAAQVVQDLRRALVNDPEPPAERRARLASRAAAAAAAARRAAAPGTAVMLEVYAAGLVEIAELLAPGRSPAAADAAARARTVLDELAAVDRARRRLPAAAAVTDRLADVLWFTFTRSPGRDAGDLAPGLQEDLDRLTAIAATTSDAAAADLGVLHAAVRSRVSPDDGRQAGARLDECGPHPATAAREGEQPASLPTLIAANRLARATRIARATAGRLSAAVAALGLPSAAATVGFDDAPAAVRSAAGTSGPFARSTAVLDEIVAASGQPPLPQAAVARGATATGGMSPAAASADGAGSGNAPLDPRGTAGGAGGSGPPGSVDAAAATGPPERVWTLLPARAKPDGFRRAGRLLDPAYDAAIDRYYLLLERRLSPDPQAP